MPSKARFAASRMTRPRRMLNGLSLRPDRYGVLVSPWCAECFAIKRSKPGIDAEDRRLEALPAQVVTFARVEEVSKEINSTPFERPWSSYREAPPTSSMFSSRLLGNSNHSLQEIAVRGMQTHQLGSAVAATRELAALLGIGLHNRRPGNSQRRW